MAKKTDINFPLDISAILHMGTKLENYSNMFRQDIVLTEEVDPEILQQALRLRVELFNRLHSAFSCNYLLASADCSATFMMWQAWSIIRRS